MDGSEGDWCFSVSHDHVSKHKGLELAIGCRSATSIRGSAVGNVIQGGIPRRKKHHNISHLKDEPTPVSPTLPLSAAPLSALPRRKRALFSLFPPHSLLQWLAHLGTWPPPS